MFTAVFHKMNNKMKWHGMAADRPFNFFRAYLAKLCNAGYLQCGFINVTFLLCD